MLGGILGWGIQELVASASDLHVWLFVLVALGCLATCLVILSYVPALVGFSADKYTEMVRLAKETKDLLDDALKYRAEVIPRESVYPEMASCIRRAKQQVAVITYYMYDWKKGQRIFLPPEQVVTGKEDFYQALYDCIENPDVEYIRIWQVPTERKSEALKVIEADPLHKREIELIRRVSLQKPDQARLVIAGEHTTASFILVDKKHLFFNVDFYDKERNVWLSPCMIVIKDATESAFVELNSIIVRLTSRTLDE